MYVIFVRQECVLNPLLYRSEEDVTNRSFRKRVESEKQSVSNIFASYDFYSKTLIL